MPQLFRYLKDLWRYSQLPSPRRNGPVRCTEAIYDAVERQLVEAEFDVRSYSVDSERYETYLRAADYDQYADYYAKPGSGSFAEKSLEHFIAADLLKLQPEETYIDIANDHSPTPDIYHRLFGCKTYAQDLRFPTGMHGDRIGGDAAELPLPEGFVDAMALHCSFEHFEGDSDMRFIRECERILRPGGRVCILPLYLFHEYAIQTDPMALPPGGIEFDHGATIHCARGYNNRHGRFYDAAHLNERVRRRLGDLRLTIYVVRNAGEIDASCYVRYVALIEKSV